MLLVPGSLHPEPIEVTAADSLSFQYGQGSLQIPYHKVNTVEYGQAVSRRYAEALLLSPVFLLSKSHKHFVTLGYVDAEGKQQAVVFRVHKGGIGAVLAGLEARTGRRVEYQDQEARKAGKDETRPRHSRCAGSGGCRGRSAP